MRVSFVRIKRQLLSRVYLVRGLVAVLAGVLVVGVGVGLRPVVTQAVKWWRTSQAGLPTHAGRTNFVLLGMAGGDHEGADLTDTIIFASVEKEGRDVVLVTTPRDLWVDTLRAKINTAYHYGEQRQPGGGGLILIKAAISEVIGQPVDYAVAINFAGFEKIIDALGGVDVTVERAFDDYHYPIAGREDDGCGGDLQYRCRFEELHFAAGRQHLDGQTALKYVRSRQAEGDEGSDFARSRRQERLILAVREKLLSLDILTRPAKWRELYDLVGQAIESDITPQRYPALVKLAGKASRVSVRSGAIVEPLVYNPPLVPDYGYQWVLLPKGDDSSVLPTYVKNLLTVPVQD